MDGRDKAQSVEGCTLGHEEAGSVAIPDLHPNDTIGVSLHVTIQDVQCVDYRGVVLTGFLLNF